MTTATQAPTSTPRTTPVKRRRWGWLVFVGIAIVAAASGAWYVSTRGFHLSSGGDGSGAEPAKRADEGTLVKTVRLAPGGIARTSHQIGSVQAYEEADLFAKISGYLKTLLVDYGTKVKRGQLLAEIDDPEVAKEKERAAAAVAQAVAAVKQAQAHIETARADLKAAQAVVQQTLAEIYRATSKVSYRAKVLERFKELVARQAETQQIVDEEEKNYEAAVADEQAAKAAEVTAQAKVVAAQAKVDQALADLAEAQANVKVAEATLGKATVMEAYTRITSPYDGVITKRNFFRGAFIRSAVDGVSVPLLSVARTDEVRVVTYVPDRYVPALDVGDPAEVTLVALPGQVFKGKVSRFADSEDPTSRTMHTEIDLPNPDDKLRPGMSGYARIIVDTETKRSTLPSTCLVGVSRGDNADVYVVKDGKAKKTQVHIGADDGLRLEVLDGLKPDDEVILNTGSIAEGMAVRTQARP